MTYSEKLKDPRWQRKRLEVMEAAGFHCEMCDAEDRTLHVHHKEYIKGREPWEYESSELQCLCEQCHETTHKLKRDIKFALSEMGIGDVETVLGFAHGLLMTTEPDVYLVRSRSYEHALGISLAVGLDDREIIELFGSMPTGITGAAIDDLLKRRNGKG